MIEPKYTKPIYLDQMDHRLIEVINNEGSIERSLLPEEYPEFADVPSSTLSYRVNSMAENGYIRVERQGDTLVLYSVEL